MKTESIFVKELDLFVTFHIGKKQDDNFDVIDMVAGNDLWFHANNISSCHVVCEVPKDQNLSKKQMMYLVKIGALLCKNNTNKLKSVSNVEIIYTKIQNVTKTSVPGCVITKNTKMIVI
jgi:predicted ribosome quality control (RQC) complex YloA/Tae2 family protein